MSDLPADRLEPAPPFTYSAVDFFGPIYVKEGRKQMKRYGAMFTCLASRAIHIEVAYSLSTDSFINCYRRFVCRRGPVRLLGADRGTNFIGVKGEQETVFMDMDQDKIRRELLKDHYDWIQFEMNVPHASHMGGVWERMIRSARNALSGLLTAHSDRLDDDSLSTLLTEAEVIVNSRPLTNIDTQSPDSPMPLSPNQLLTLKTKVVMPPTGNFIRKDTYLHRRWRHVQYLANEFWSRWRKEFLPTLQERKKWIRQHRDVQVGDIVLMIDDSAPRNQWPLGRIAESFQSADGYVRKVKLKVRDSTYERPVHKLILLLTGEDPVEEPK
ncbi:uncharacterized protein LOC106172794 [Lingula anatina]|uniref:Uncharacterized protein LOC106172794 n=1 Tax=Lingula anatina TaxID=7574 RepID=A0A1S3JGX4_LINAN|nr:uncharacterized protein LOC106172794 [Lingula anatina]|eukprot:XP_013409149.1 uncharacterized protein LOC106172794 [Lingula anatina]